MALLRSPRTDYPFQLSFVLSRYRQCCAACPHATQHSRSETFVKLCLRHYTRWNPDRAVVEFGIGVGEYEGVVRVSRRVFQILLPQAPTPERCLEAYHLHRTRLELIAERKLPRRQVTDDGNVENTG